MPLTCVTWDYEASATISDEVRAAHLAYLHDLVDRGLLLAAGPRSDAPGGVLLFSAPQEDVSRLLDADPFSSIPLITTTTITPFTAAVGALSASPTPAA